ncbi:MAG: phospholipase D family protein [Dongiaceae bacterium]
MNNRSLALHSLVLICALGWLLSGCGTTVDWDYPRTPSTAFTQPQTTTVGALFQEVADQHPGLSGFSLVREGGVAFTARVAMADLAEKTLDAQYYIWDVDTTGRILADRLIRAADRGVRVRLLLDDHYQTEEIDRGIAALDAHPNIEVRFFNPVENRRWRGASFLADFSRVNHRMHNKLFIMDNAVGVAGGRNIADTYFGVRPDQNFRDLDMVMAGPIVRDLSASFDLYWNSKWAIPAGAVVDKRAEERDLQALKERLAEKVEAAGYPYPINEKVEDLRARIVAIRNAFVWAPGRVLAEDPARVETDEGGQVVRQAIAQRLTDTHRELSIESPYFILSTPGIKLARELTARGVRVRVLTNSAATNDVLAAQAGYIDTRKDLLKAGVELYELRPDSNMKRHWSVIAGRSRAALHAKAMVFDRETVFMGSFNLDPRSRDINTEIGIMIDSPEVSRQLVEFMDDGVSPGSAYHVTLGRDDKIEWTAETDGKMVEFHEEPETSWSQRFLIDVLRVLPIDEQL